MQDLKKAQELKASLKQSEVEMLGVCMEAALGSGAIGGGGGTVFVDSEDENEDDEDDAGSGNGSAEVARGTKKKSGTKKEQRGPRWPN